MTDYNKRMTVEEAVKVLKDLRAYEHSERFSEKEIREALNMAIDIMEMCIIDLEWDPIPFLDKIQSPGGF